MSAPQPLPAVTVDTILDRWARDLPGTFGAAEDATVSVAITGDGSLTVAALTVLASARDDLTDAEHPAGDVHTVAAAIVGCAVSQLHDTDGHDPATWWQRICEQADDWAAYVADGPGHEALADLRPEYRIGEADCRANDALGNLRRIVEELR